MIENVRRVGSSARRRGLDGSRQLSRVATAALSQRGNLAYVSHHKCGTQWTLGVLGDLLDHAAVTHATFDWRDDVTCLDLLRFEVLMIQDYDLDMNVDLESVERGLHVVRDPRDLLISLYYSHRDSHPVRDPLAWEILRDRAVLRQCSVLEGLRFLYDHSGYFRRVMESMENWQFDPDRFLELRFEDFVKGASPEGIRGALGFLGIEVPAAFVVQVLQSWDFSRLRAAAGSGGETQHYRAGAAGAWREVFDAELVDRFCVDHPEVFTRFGYPVR